MLNCTFKMCQRESQHWAHDTACPLLAIQKPSSPAGWVGGIRRVLDGVEATKQLRLAGPQTAGPASYIWFGTMKLKATFEGRRLFCTP